MKFTLKSYQADAVADVLENLERARTIFHRDDEVSSFSLTAATGAGKTVMAAAAIEALFFGNSDLEFDADPGAVVIWFSDDPNLNEQSRMRLLEASDKLTHSHLVTIESPFDRPKLESRKVYFLNTQKLGKNSLLVRGHVDDPDAPRLDLGPPPDLQGRTIWETIGNTIADDDLTLYLVLDEAHRGFRAKSAKDRPTIVRRLITGDGAQPPIPVVWGISATIGRFEQAMEEADAAWDRRKLDSVVVDPSLVQESGLVKDTVALNIPNEAGDFDSVLVRVAARKLRESSERWAEYAAEQGDAEPVRPLLVLQTPNTPDPDQIGVAIDTILGEYPEIGVDQIRHVLGEHSVQTFGAYEVPWIEPQSVEDRTFVRILIAKDAISTGWDCPRAEVLVSFRTAQDHTYITQLLGRMVRSPLARRVQGDELLNSVDCILPFVDRTTAGQVVRYLTGELVEMPGVARKKVLLDARELGPNPRIPTSVWEAWDSLPSETLPQRGARPTKRLVALAHELSADGIRPGALKEVEARLHEVLDDYAERYAAQLDEAVNEIWKVEIQEIAGVVGRAGLTYREFVERADDRAIRSGFEGAKQAFGADVAQSYVDHLAGDDADDDELREAYVKASALAIVPEARKKIDAKASKIAAEWFDGARSEIANLVDDRRSVYEEIRAMAVEPQRTDLSRPRTRLEDYAVLGEDDETLQAQLVERHLMSDDDGHFPLSSLNGWEQKVVEIELGAGAVGWYRNPPRQAVDSLGVSYRDSQGNWRSMHPDFVFFHDVDGEVRASIVDPHGQHLDDAAAKLRALARFAAEHGDGFDRIDAVAEVNGVMRTLGLNDETVRDGVMRELDAGVGASELYGSELGADLESVVAG